MKRRDFFKQSAGAVGIAAMAPVAGTAAAPTNSQGERLADQWQQLGTGTTQLPSRTKTLRCDVAVVGGGLIKMDFEKVKTTAVRIGLKETYGHPTAKLFEVRCYENA